MKEIVKEYTDGEVTIIWKPQTCIHSAICVGGLPDAFKPKEKPWIKIDAVSKEKLIDQVKKCPSGALSYYMNEAGKQEEPTDSGTSVVVFKNGPLKVHGTLEVTHKDGSKEVKNRTTAFCRCGASANKPYCDGAHVKINFED